MLFERCIGFDNIMVFNVTSSIELLIQAYDLQCYLLHKIALPISNKTTFGKSCASRCPHLMDAHSTPRLKTSKMAKCSSFAYVLSFRFKTERDGIKSKMEPLLFSHLSQTYAWITLSPQSVITPN